VPSLVCDRNAAGTLGDGGEDLSILFHVNDSSAIRTDLRARGGRGEGIGEGHSAKVGERNKFSVLLIVLDNPLGILQAKCRRRRDILRHLLTAGQILDHG
jgi:hypothetical protein